MRALVVIVNDGVGMISAVPDDACTGGSAERCWRGLCGQARL
jgi:hypothetical protein